MTKAPPWTEIAKHVRMTLSGAWSLMRASMGCDLIAPDAAMLMLLLCLCPVPTAPNYAFNIFT
jgi:hypothetical protein